MYLLCVTGRRPQKRVIGLMVLCLTAGAMPGRRRTGEEQVRNG